MQRGETATRAGRTRGVRLSEAVRPTEVDLALEVDPGRSARFVGEVRIRLRLERATRTLELHAVDLRLAGARVEAGDAAQRGRVEPRPRRETVRVHLPRPVPAGEATLHLRFRGTLRRDLKGLYAASDGEHRYAFTQLEATDARRFFPCFDEPAFKARFRLRVTTGADNAVISNAPEARVETLPDGRKTVHFRPTPPLSTYLVALAVGPLEASRAVRVGRTPVRVWHVPGKRGLTRFALEAARACLTRLETYFDLSYPYEKLDLVAVPDFEFGAMENAGAVFFRETLLLVDPRTVTLGEQKRAAEVICHELAHMWYGDLVTMAWWNDLWLNEAFATWMAFHVVDAWKPDWKMWHDFDHHRAAAFDLDALQNTHAIYADVRTPEEATENFDVITYEKGAAVVRMVERYLGPGTFRRGVRRYIRRHREGNAQAADLWRALSEAADQEVEPVVRAWIEQPGFPLVALRRRARGGAAQLELRQQRFRTRPDGADGTLWPVPVVARVGGPGRRSRLLRHLLTRRSERIPLPGAPRFVYGNADEGAFFRPLHDDAELRALAGSLPALAAVERMGLVRHQWAAVRARLAPLASFLDLCGAFADETDPDVLQALRGPLGFVDGHLLSEREPEARDAFRVWLIERFADAQAELGWEPSPREDDERRLRRAAWIALLGGVAKWEPVLHAAAARAPRYLDDRSALDANLADAVVSLAARRGDAALHDAYRAAAGDSDTPQERRRFLMALGDFRDPALVGRTLRLTLTRDVPTQDVALLLARLLTNEAARERAWRFARANWERLARRMPSMLATRIIEATPALATRAHRREVAAFFRRHPVPTGARTLRQALERFDRNAELRRRALPELRRWLAAQTANAPSAARQRPRPARPRGRRGADASS